MYTNPNIAKRLNTSTMNINISSIISIKVVQNLMIKSKSSKKMSSEEEQILVYSITQ